MFPTWDATIKEANKFWSANHNDLLFKQRFRSKDSYMEFVKANYAEARKRGEGELARTNNLLKNHFEDLYDMGTRLRKFDSSLKDVEKVLTEKKKIDKGILREK